MSGLKQRVSVGVCGGEAGDRFGGAAGWRQTEVWRRRRSERWRFDAVRWRRRRSRRRRLLLVEERLHFAEDLVDRALRVNLKKSRRNFF